jgi:hypothetical protein
MKIELSTKDWLSINSNRVGNSIKLPTLLAFPMVLLFSILSLTPLRSSTLPIIINYSFPSFLSTQLLPCGYGPEDIVVDSLHNPPRILVSCASRRPENPDYGEIEAIVPAQRSRIAMARVGEPAGLVLRPHGISLVQAGEIQYLYVITHDDKKDIHLIVLYQLDQDTLVFVKTLSTRLLVSPNALQAYSDGSLLVCNDAAVRGSMKEKIFRQKKGNVIYFDGEGNWSIVASGLGMPAGLTGMGSYVFVSAALENTLYSYRFKDGQLTDKKPVCQIKGPDNIRICNNKLIVTSHSRMIRFIRHVKNKTHNSPSLVIEIDPQTGKSVQLFYDNGKLISAASVAVIFNNQLIVGQIFEPFICLLNLEK